MGNGNNILGSYKPLDRLQLKHNARYVSVRALLVALVAIGVAASVMTGIIWIAPSMAAVCLTAYILIIRHSSFHYTTRFGGRFNLLRFSIAGFIIYRFSAWRGLFGLYNHLYFREGYDISPLRFGLTVLIASGALFLTANLILNRTTDPRMADALAIAETIGVVLAFGSAFFLIQYN